MTEYDDGCHSDGGQHDLSLLSTTLSVRTRTYKTALKIHVHMERVMLIYGLKTQCYIAVVLLFGTVACNIHCSLCYHGCSLY